MPIIPTVDSSKTSWRNRTAPIAVEGPAPSSCPVWVRSAPTLVRPIRPKLFTPKSSGTSSPSTSPMRRLW